MCTHGDFIRPAPLGDWVAGTMTSYPTQLHNPETANQPLSNASIDVVSHWFDSTESQTSGIPQGRLPLYQFGHCVDGILVSSTHCVYVCVCIICSPKVYQMFEES